MKTGKKTQQNQPKPNNKQLHTAEPLACMSQKEFFKNYWFFFKSVLLEKCSRADYEYLTHVYVN